MPVSRYRCLIVVSALLGLLGQAQVSTAQTQQDAAGAPFAASATQLLRTEFRLAYELARNGMPAIGSDRAALREYALYPYLEAARLGRAAAAAEGDWGAADDDVLAFLAEHDGEPVDRNLRVAWLQSLARRESWPAYLEHYREEVAGTALRCQYVTARIELGESAGLAPLVLEEWLTGAQLPGECEPVFQWGREQGVIDADATEARVRLLLENGQPAFARVIARRLPEARAVPLLAWADLIERPLGALEAYIAVPSSDIDGQMLLDGWSRLARDNPETALGLYDQLVSAEQFDREAASPYALALALGLAWDRRPEALDFFAQVADADRDDYALEWQARAALWADDWDLVRSSIASMSVELRDTSRWRYWAARASEDRDERERLYRSVLPNDNYYAAAAAARLRERAEPHPEHLTPDPVMIGALTDSLAMLRATELWHVGLPVAAAREWQYGSEALVRDQREQSIFLAMDIGWYDLAVATATGLRIFNDYNLLYPRPYAEPVSVAAREFNLDPTLVYAVIRQESLYRANARSSAGALGLMQLRRGTAQDVAARLGAGGVGDLLDPAVNVRLGSAELERLLARYQEQLAPALAAYNAGPSAADRWLPPEPIDGDVWLENIPYNETREYVGRVLWHSVVFEWLEHGRGVDTRDWLRPIRPD
jgi:soluble lytic murein transglycosylase